MSSPTQTPETLDLAQALNNESSESTSPVSQSENKISSEDSEKHQDATDTIHQGCTYEIKDGNTSSKPANSSNGNQSEEKIGVKFSEIISRSSSSGLEIRKESEGSIRRIRRLENHKVIDSSSSGELIKLTSENRLGTITSLPQVLEETEEDGDTVQIFASTTGKFSLEKIGSFTMSPCPKCGRKISQGAMKRHEKYCYVETRP